MNEEILKRLKEIEVEDFVFIIFIFIIIFSYIANQVEKKYFLSGICNIQHACIMIYSYQQNKKNHRMRKDGSIWQRSIRKHTTSWITPWRWSALLPMVNTTAVS